MHRREFVSLGAAALGAAAFESKVSFGRPRMQSGVGGGLKAQACGRLIGVQADTKDVKNPKLSSFINANFNMLTPGNQLKWTATEPTQGNFSFSEGDWMVNYAKSHGLAVHGHNLAWNASNPAWVNQTVNSSNARKILENHITKVVSHYKGQIDSWDVANEPIAVWHKQPGGLYAGPWQKALGAQYMDVAFNACAAADPAALRVMNVHHVEQDDPKYAGTREAVIALVKQLQQRQVPIQAVALESHLTLAAPVMSPGRDNFIRTLMDMGIQILITELDVNDSAEQSDSGTRDQKVASYYQQYLTSVISVANPKRIIMWSPTDQNNWIDYMISHNSNVDAQFARNDGSRHRIALTDDSMQPKAAYSAVASVLQSTCHT